MEYNIWDLNRINIRVKVSFLNKMNSLILKNFLTKRNFYNQFFANDLPFSTFNDLLKLSRLKKNFIPLKLYLKISNYLGIDRNELQKNILAYKTTNGPNFVENPKLPIEISPVFHMLLAHNIADGTVINPKNGRLPYFGYRQFDKFYRIAYIRKAEFVFGKINYSKEYFETTTRSYLPASLSNLFFKHYCFSIDDFLSDKARIPLAVFESGGDSLLAFLIAFIIDEGHVDSSQIVINLKNPALIKDLYNICLILGYESKIVEGRGDYTKFSRLYILRKGMKKIYEDYIKLNNQYPVIDLGWKGKKIEDSFKIYSRKIIRISGNKDLIFEILKKENLSVNQLAFRLNMTRQGVRFHIHNLLNDNKIRIVNKDQLNWIYGV